MKNSSFSNKHICDICNQELLIHYSELNDLNNSNNNCYETEDDDSELFLTSENYQFSNNYSNEIIFDLLKNETIQNIINSLIRVFDQT